MQDFFCNLYAITQWLYSKNLSKRMVFCYPNNNFAHCNTDFSMTYHTLTTPCQAQLEIKKSEFLGFAYPITDREQLMFHVEQLRTQYPDARHICYGYIIGDPNNTTSAGFDDDGEPGGTAGKPILTSYSTRRLVTAPFLWYVTLVELSSVPVV